jgi:hypothetical protein
MALLILVGRPIASFTHDLVVQQAIAPGMTNLIRWQTHRYVLRQSVTYFANDLSKRSRKSALKRRFGIARRGAPSKRKSGSKRKKRRGSFEWSRGNWRLLDRLDATAGFRPRNPRRLL